LERTSPTPPPVALTIAGHDPSSGAGITADLQVFSAHGIFGTSAITSLTVQSTLGVSASEPLSQATFSKVLDHLNVDLPPDGVKIGMLGSADLAESTAKFLQQLHLDKRLKSNIPCVLDPVIRSSSGADLLSSEGLETLLRKLLPAVSWITPNWSELALLTDQSISSLAEAESAAALLNRQYPHVNVVVTGGDQLQPIDLLYTTEGCLHHFAGEHIESTSTHGTGCAFSSALLCQLISGIDSVNAILAAKRYVAEAIRRAPAIGHGRGPLNLLWPLQTK
jgi:hydroxymethylpyrimidine/phosphomethylpyrimidine kinase